MHICKASFIVLLGLTLHVSDGAERINHEGRILGPEPVVTSPILFNTPEADAILSAMQIFPRDNPWNEDISRRPVLGNSDAMIAQIIADLRSDRRTLRAFHEMNFVLVPDNQPLVDIDFIYYEDESDPSPYPLPANLPVETWPRETGGLSLADWQRDINDEGGDRHSITVMPGAGTIWETWLTRLTPAGWEAANGAKFNLKSNTLRPFGWTSGDAAGLPMFPALVRYDECQRGMVEHAMRLIVKRTRVGPIYPATHQASVGNLTDTNIPAMGQRLRLKQSFEIPDSWTIYEKAVLRGLKKYGAIVADNGNFFSISMTPDDRYPANAFSRLSSISITNFEVIQTTDPAEGPRSPNPPQADAGADRSATVNSPIQLNGNTANATGVQWSVYSGPGNVTFSDPSAANTTATFTTPGTYILMLTAADGVHAPAFDALEVNVGTSLGTIGAIQIVENNGTLNLAWESSATSFTVEETDDLSSPWRDSGRVEAKSYSTLATNNHRFFRVRAN